MAEQTTPDADQALRKANRLRQRLVGAAVLIALAVLLLPIWLDGSGLRAPRVEPVPEPPKVAHPDKIEVPAPPPQQIEALKNPPRQLMPPPHPAAPAPSGAEQQSPAQSPVPETKVQSETSGDSSAKTAASSKADQMSQAPVAKETKPAPAKETKPAPTKPADSSKAEPAKAESTPKAVANGKWVVQLGSFSDELNARGLQKSVSEAGFKVYVEPLFAKKGTVWRVRVGPFASRDDANKATERLRERLGRDGLVMPQ